MLYDMYERFQHSYYNQYNVDPVLSPKVLNYKAVLFFIDFSRHAKVFVG